MVGERLKRPHPLIMQSAEIIKASEPNSLGLREPAQKGCLDIQVSKKSLPRALRIMDALIKALGGRGHQVFFSEGSTQVRIFDVPLSFNISEQLVTKRSEPWHHNLEGYDHNTGRLAVCPLFP
jgi:hypothetical protein